MSSMGSQRNGFNKESFILSVDVGTTSIRCHVYDKEAKIRGSCTTKVMSLTAFTPPSLIIHVVQQMQMSATFLIVLSLILVNLSSGCPVVSRGRTCRDGPRGTMGGVHHCGQRGCARYSWTSSCCPI